VRSSLLVGLVVGLTAAGLALTFIALPLFFFASAADPSNGTGRPFIRTGLVAVAIPFGVVAGLVAGPLAGRWWRRGGRLGREEDGYWGS
jgi:hypothetical protein